MYNLFAKANKKRAKRRGFTLIELVIVIVILGVLAGVAALSFQNVTQSSKHGVAKANLRALKSAAQVYQADHNGDLPKNIDKLVNYLDEDLKNAIGKGKNNKTGGYTFTLTPGTNQIVIKVAGNKIETESKDGTEYILSGTVEK